MISFKQFFLESIIDQAKAVRTNATAWSDAIRPYLIDPTNVPGGFFVKNDLTSARLDSDVFMPTPSGFMDPSNTSLLRIKREDPGRFGSYIRLRVPPNDMGMTDTHRISVTTYNPISLLDTSSREWGTLEHELAHMYQGIEANKKKHDPLPSRAFHFTPAQRDRALKPDSNHPLEIPVKEKMVDFGSDMSYHSDRQEANARAVQRGNQARDLQRRLAIGDLDPSKDYTPEELAKLARDAGHRARLKTTEIETRERDFLRRFNDLYMGGLYDRIGRPKLGHKIGRAITDTDDYIQNRIARLTLDNEPSVVADLQKELETLRARATGTTKPPVDVTPSVPVKPKGMSPGTKLGVATSAIAPILALTQGADAGEAWEVTKQSILDPSNYNPLSILDGGNQAGLDSDGTPRPGTPAYDDYQKELARQEMGYRSAEAARRRADDTERFRRAGFLSNPLEPVRKTK